MKKLRRARAHLRGGTPLLRSLARSPARRVQHRIISPFEELIRGEFTRLRASARRRRIQLRVSLIDTVIAPYNGIFLTRGVI